jgi:hypothetical protein
VNLLSNKNKNNILFHFLLFIYLFTCGVNSLVTLYKTTCTSRYQQTKSRQKTMQLFWLKLAVKLTHGKKITHDNSEYIATHEKGIKSITQWHINKNCDLIIIVIIWVFMNVQTKQQLLLLLFTFRLKSTLRKK